MIYLTCNREEKQNNLIFLTGECKGISNGTIQHLGEGDKLSTTKHETKGDIFLILFFISYETLMNCSKPKPACSLYSMVHICKNHK